MALSSILKDEVWKNTEMMGNPHGYVGLRSRFGSGHIGVTTKLLQMRRMLSANIRLVQGFDGL